MYSRTQITTMSDCYRGFRSFGEEHSFMNIIDDRIIFLIFITVYIGEKKFIARTRDRSIHTVVRKRPMSVLLCRYGIRLRYDTINAGRRGLNICSFIG